MITAAGIVIPAQNEAALLGACLESVQQTTRFSAFAGLEVACVVVLDSCTDGSRAVAEEAFRAYSGSAALVEIAVANVGLARAAGISSLLTRLRHHRRSRTWIATTDADTRVPESWLADHIRLANEGADAVAGIVEIDDWSEHPGATRWCFEAQYVIAPDGSHTHVHGANLGLRASSYLAAGGMPGVALAEDHRLLDALVATGATVSRTSAVRVTTSARRHARAVGGFSDLLASLAIPRT